MTRCRHRWTELTKHTATSTDVDTGRDYCYLCGVERKRPKARKFISDFILHLQEENARQERVMREMAKAQSKCPHCPLSITKFLGGYPIPTCSIGKSGYDEKCTDDIYTHYAKGVK